jgi:hypothetical protein
LAASVHKTLAIEQCAWGDYRPSLLEWQGMTWLSGFLKNNTGYANFNNPNTKDARTLPVKAKTPLEAIS